MSNYLPWNEIAIRLALTIIVGAVVGVNRTERGRAVGLRTTILVCLAASASMIQMQLLLATRGKSPDGYAVLDLMRLPLGILTGMGFIGAGAIFRSNGSVQGVTTAATLWLVTVVGLCIGGGQLMLGVVTASIALLALWSLRRFEQMIHRDCSASLSMRVAPAGPTEQEIRTSLLSAGYQIKKWDVVYRLQDDERQLLIRAEVHWVGEPDETLTPDIVEQFKRNREVLSIRWSS